VSHLLSLATPPTAIVAGNDNIAVRAIQHARTEGVCVPESLSMMTPLRQAFVCRL
jgi:DNA-binding LacI/PurR family transcriptional regulator